MQYEGELIMTNADNIIKVLNEAQILFLDMS